MKLKRTIVKKIDMENDTDVGFVKGTPEERFLMVWELTKDAWSFVKDFDAEQRLQRNITNIIRK